MRTRIVAAIGIVVVLAGMATVLMPSMYEVVDHGRNLRPYESAPVYEIRIADSITFYAAEDSRPNPDVFTGSALVALATASLIAFLILGAASRDQRPRRFYGLSSIGFALLAVDEFFAVHETIGHNLVFLADLPGIERPDDAVFLLFLIPAAVFIYAFRDIMFGSRRLKRYFGAALVTFVLAALSDIGGLLIEEPLEVLSGLFIVIGFALLIAEHISACLKTPGEEERAAAEAATAREPAKIQG